MRSAAPDVFISRFPISAYTEPIQCAWRKLNNPCDDGVIDPNLPLSDWLDALAQTVVKVQCPRRETTAEEALLIVEAYSSDGLRIAVLNLCENMDDYEIRIDGR